MDPVVTFLPEEGFGPSHDERTQYRFTFYPGAAATAPAGDMFPSGIKGYSEWAYVAAPSTKLTSRLRSFCVDPSGAVWSAAPPHTIVLVKGRCPEGLRLIQ
jgi:hypothetical protein